MGNDWSIGGDYLGGDGGVLGSSGGLAPWHWHWHRNNTCSNDSITTIAIIVLNITKSKEAYQS